MPVSLTSLAIHLPEGPDTITGITLEHAASEFVRYGSEPGVIIEGRWWRLDPKRPHFHQRAHSKRFVNWGDAKDLAPKGLEGQIPNRPSPGALAPVGSDER
jgi:hypothetical protein